MRAALLALLLLSPALAEERVVLRTGRGDLLVELDAELAPRHAERFLSLARSGAYDAVPLACVQPGYLVQFGAARGSEGLPALKGEFGGLHARGRLSMCRSPEDPDSAVSSFCLMLAEAPHLDGKYTVFGRVVAGLEALDALEAEPRGAHGRPLAPLVLERAEVVDASIPVALAPAVFPPPYRPPAWWVRAGWGLLAAGLAGFLLGAGRARSAALLSALSGGALLFAVLGPRAPASPTSALILFLCVLGMIRLMGRFERA